MKQIHKHKTHTFIGSQTIIPFYIFCILVFNCLSDTLFSIIDMMQEIIAKLDSSKSNSHKNAIDVPYKFTWGKILENNNYI